MKTTDPAVGLSSAEVAERTARGLVNRTRRSDLTEYLDIVNRNVLTLFNALVVPAAIALFYLSDQWGLQDDNFKAALAVSGMAVTNTLLGLFQEVRAKRQLDRLTLLAEVRVHVRRDGQVVEVPAGEVVQGDVVQLAAGDPVVADGPVLVSRFLEVDEALLTGESDPVPRKPGDRVLSGSFAVAGEGSYHAERVGAEAFAQKTASEARSYRYTASPMQEQIDQLIRVLTAVAVALCGSYLLLDQVRGYRNDELVRMVAATITSMVPQGLVLMATLAFLLGAVRMTRRGVIVNRLSAVEAMAEIDTLCMDKTGTLTTNRLKLAGVTLLGPDLGEEEVRGRLRLFASNSLDQSKALGAIREALGDGDGELIDQLPFKSQNRYSAVRVRSGGGDHALVLGAPEALRSRLEGGDWEKAWREQLATGLRLLIFAEVAGGLRERFDGSLDGLRLRPLALVALSDEVRPEAPAVLDHLASQRIEFKILSGDNQETVRATVTALPQFKDAGVVSGADLEGAKDAEEVILSHTVFGRVSPWQKVEIVRALRGKGRRVAMIGDGVNDVLPIKNANLGIAMGDGARASKTVSGIVLQTNDFGLLPQLLDEGRVIVRNLRRAGKLFLTKNAYMLLMIVGTVGVFNLPFPLEPQQVTLLNFLTIGLPALLIMLNHEKAPASRAALVREVGGFALRTGVIVGAAALAMQLASARVWQDGDKTQKTVVLTLLVLLGCINLVRALREPSEVSLWPRDPLLPWLPGAALLVYLISTHVPLTAEFFALAPLSFGRWAWIIAAAAVTTIALGLSDRLLGRHELSVTPAR